MSNKFKAADDIKKLGKFLQGFMEFAGELESLGSLEQSAKETENRIESLKKDEAQARSLFDNADNHLKLKQKEADECIRDAELSADQARTKAGIKAQSILDEAVVKAQDFHDITKEKCDALIANINSLCDQEKELIKSIGYKTSQIQELQKHINDIKAKLGA